MNKYRVHTYQTIRVAYEIEAESADAAKELVEADGWKMTPVEVTSIDDSCDWTQDYVVDPLLPNGEVDYENVVTYQGE